MSDRTSIIGGIIFFALVWLLWTICPKDLSGWEAQGPQGDLFSNGGTLEFTMEADFQALMKDRKEESKYRPARMILTNPDGSTLELALEVRTRGNFRLQKANCSFPPLKLDLPKGKLTGTVLAGQDKLKLVTHCRNRDDYEQNLLEEFLAYRIQNLITDLSFRVQLAQVSYVDTSGKMKPLTRYAFLIESKEEMAQRLGGTFLEVPQVHPDRFDPHATGTMYLFQYLIGNVDWSIAYFHNVKLVRIGADHYPVAYDFDWSGLVNAPYALPHPKLTGVIRSVRQRLYRGFCSDRIDFGSISDLFLGKRGEILSEISAQPGLEEKNVRSARKYVEEFFKILEEKDRLPRRVRNTCRTLPRS